MTFELPILRALLPAAMATLAAALIALLLAGAPVRELGSASSASAEPDAGAPSNATSSYGSLPLSFQPNAGRGDPRLDFVTHTSAASVYLDARGATLVPAQAPASGAQALQMQMVGADPAAPHALERLPGVVNDLRGDDPARWATEIPTFERVRYSSLYPGVALDWYGNQRRLEYDFRLSPHADPGQIAVRMAGADGLRLAANGDLVIGAFGEQIRQLAPVAYQPAAHGAPRRPVDVAYDVSGNTVGFELGAYDKRRPLVIDPLMLTYATYLGGGLVDEGRAIAVDPAGAAYIAGSTSSTDFDRVGGIEGNEADVDAFVTKLNPAGSAIVYSTYLGGNGNDQAHGIAVDSAGAAHITGHTSSIDLNLHNEFETDSGTIDAFVSKLTPAGSALAYSTYLGGPASTRRSRSRSAPAPSTSPAPHSRPTSTASAGSRATRATPTSTSSSPSSIRRSRARPRSSTRPTSVGTDTTRPTESRSTPAAPPTSPASPTRATSISSARSKAIRRIATLSSRS